MSGINRVLEMVVLMARMLTLVAGKIAKDGDLPFLVEYVKLHQELLKLITEK